MFGFLKNKYYKFEENQIVIDYNPDVKRVLMIRAKGLTNNQIIDALHDGVRCMGGKVKKRKRK